MKVYTLTLVYFDDRYRVDYLVGVDSNLEKLIEEREHSELPVYSNQQDNDDECDWGDQDGYRGYVWQEWEV